MGFGIKKAAETIQNIVDMHCHVLYGVDDGASDLEESLKMLRLAEEQGITHVVCTPHYKNHRRMISEEGLRKNFEDLKREAESSGIQVKLYLGNEIFYFQELEKALDEKKVIPMNESKYLLVEFYPQESYQTIRNAMYEISSLGMKPILAHAERYDCLVKQPSRIFDLRNAGVKIQINASAVTGDFGFSAKYFVRSLLKKQMVDYISTDAHTSGERAPDIKKCVEYLNKKYEHSYVENILAGNAARDFLL